MSAHAPACRTVGVSFFTLAFEALGGMSEATTTSLSRIGRLLGQRLGVSPAASIRHPFQRGSVFLWPFYILTALFSLSFFLMFLFLCF